MTDQSTDSQPDFFADDLPNLDAVLRHPVDVEDFGVQAALRAFSV